MELGQVIAFNLNRLRTQRNMSLGDLARESGISKAMLSDMERGNGNPTINTIWKIANGLKVPYTQLIDHVDSQATVVRREETDAQTGEDPSYRVYCYYKTTPARNFELFYVELDPQSSYPSVGHSERAQEYLYVIRGTLTLETGGRTYTLGEGDSMAFDSSAAHTYANGREEGLSFLVVNYYPS